MPMYLIYPYRADEISPRFEAVDLPDDTAAARYAKMVLKEHDSCAGVVIFRDETRLVTYRRSGAEPGEQAARKQLSG